MSIHASALQDIAYADGVCYGCGPAHPSGLRIKSRWHEDGVHVVARITPREEFIGWPGLVYGGLLAMLVDCHSNWTAMAYHYRAEGREPGSLPPIHCVTGHLGLDYLKPTPLGQALVLKARIDGPVERKTRVVCEVHAGEVLTVRGDSVFVRVDVERLGGKAHTAST